MRTRRARLIAAQTLVTVGLVAVVAAIWLTPEDGDRLFGVDVPGASPPIAQGPPSYEPGANRGGDRREANGSDAVAGGAGGAGSVPPTAGGEARGPPDQPPGRARRARRRAGPRGPDGRPVRRHPRSAQRERQLTPDRAAAPIACGSRDPSYICRVLIESRSSAAAGEAAAGDAPRSSLLGGVRTRVLVSFLALLVLSTAASVFVLREVLLSRIGDQVEEQLTRDTGGLSALRDSGQPGSGEPFSSADQLLGAYLDQTAPPTDGALVTFVDGEPFRAELTDTGDGVLADAAARFAAITEPTSGEIDTPLGEARYVAIPVRDTPPGVLVAAALTAAERDQVESAVQIAMGVSLVVLLLASLFIWLAAGRAVAPLHALSRTARTINDTDLSGRIPVTGGDEIAELGRTFNNMLDRLETAFADQKDFLTDVSHELRTPITVIRGHLETLGDSPAEREEAIAVIQDELDRMSRYVDDLLLLTKAPRPDFLRLGPLDLDLFTHDLFAKARSLGDRDWRLDGTGIGILRGDQHRLTQAVMNLADNAVRHTREGDSIWLGSSLIGEEARFWVRDEGPGVDPADRERIFARYVRSAAAQGRQADGAGLGLSIVRAIAEAHGGRVELDSRPGMGSTFTIVLPASAP